MRGDIADVITHVKFFDSRFRYSDSLPPDIPDFVLTDADGSRGVRFLPAFVCLSVCLFVLPHDVSTTDATRITKPP